MSPPPEGPARVPVRRILTLGGLTAFGPLSLDLYLPALPQLTGALDTTESLGQASMSVCMIGLAVGQLLFGPLTDRLGRRVPLLVGVGVYAVTAGLCALAPSIEVLLVLRLLGGLAGAVGIVTARAIVRDLYSGAEAARVFSLLMLVSGAAPVIAPVLGSQLMRVTDWRGLFVALAAIGLVLFGAALTQPETLAPDARRGGGLAATRRALGGVLADRSFLGPVLVLSLTTTGMFVYIAMGSYVLQGGYGLGAQAYGIVFAVNALGIVAAGRVNSVLVPRFGALRLLRAGVVVALAGGVALVAGVLLGDSVWAALGPLFFVVSAVGLLLPNGTALALDSQGAVAGSASGLLGLAQFSFGAIIPPLVSIGGVTALSMAVTILATGVAGALAAVLLRPGHPA
ncbi:DHA1 family bicyclomycin/chloramphenicol resistance-like MFS transporter [Pseudonocardia sediminis]|uniref:DHA1 family bicyclomycin/chloramphenicol resistance-like MFS transporter n=1 Tax=Pseudonocardia sediminis TaxID=1397368 RepID=A0A4Q7UZK8_PSEST|nr:multidrug effflux MFS transporter [Pseudonocardia sediminis]RZT87597.1 DHA1 family bicyclomycin/chloramphenicol resistance-like MFS transporter [Pseudonocardia sediminis]